MSQKNQKREFFLLRDVIRETAMDRKTYIATLMQISKSYGIAIFN